MGEPRRALRAVRLLSGLSQKHVAAQVPCSRGYIALIERGDRNGSPEVREAIAAALDAPIAVLFPGDNSNSNVTDNGNSNVADNSNGNVADS